MEKIPVFCGKDCGGNCCPLMAMKEQGRITRIMNNPAGGKFFTGCIRGYNMPLEVYAPDRLTKPLIRTGERGSGFFREATWEEALSLTARRLGEIRSNNGTAAVLNLGSDGQTSALHNTADLLTRFLNLSGGATTLTGNYSNGAASFVLPYLFGSRWKSCGFDPATIKYANLIILWGANPLQARLGTEVDLRLREAARRGTEIVVIDPRRSGTAEALKARWIPLRPGTDAAMMLAVLYVLITENLIDRSFVETRSTGFRDLENYVLGVKGSEPRTPAWASGVCGVPEADIIGFARTYGNTKPALLFPGYSIQRVFAGEEPYRLTVALQTATGNLGRLGGSTGSLNNRLPVPRVGTLPVPEVPSSPGVPVTRWPDLILEGTAGGYPVDIRAAYAVGCNFLNQGADVRKNIAAFSKLEFAVCHELFLTPTARYCDVVLPAAHSLEKEDIGIPWAGNFITYKPQAISPPGQALSDYDILSDLADRMGFGQRFTEGRDASAWIRYFLDSSEVADREKFLRTGVYFGKDQERTGLSDFATDPVRFPLDTPSGKVEISSGTYARETGGSPFPLWQAPPEDNRYPLLLLTPKAFRRTHSQGNSIPEIQDRTAHALEMNPEDAENRGIRDGDDVEVFNAFGRTRVPVRLSVNISPGTVSLPEGVWVAFDGKGEDTAGSANLLTSTEGTKPAVSNIMHGVGVQVRPTVSPPTL